MKKILSTAVVTALLATNAFAFGNSNNSNNTDNSVNPIANGGAAMQGQGQVGINKNKSTVKNSGNSQSDSGVYGSGNSANLNAQVDASKTTNKQKQDASSANDISIGGDSFVEAYNPVNTAYAPTVIATSDCLGSISAGGQGNFLGLSFGKTTQSTPCNVREDAKTVAALVKDEALVKATLCQSKRVAEAYKVTGEYNKYCVGAKATVKTTFFGLNKTSAYEEQDPCEYPTSGSCIASKR